MRLRVLGSGDAFNSAGALHSSYLLEGDKGTLLLECGPGALAGLKRAGVDTGVVDAVLISHLHGDHFGGIPFLFLEYRFENPRTRTLTLAGPPSLKQRVENLAAALYEDLPCYVPDYQVEHLAVRPGSRLTLAGFDIEAFEVLHSAKPFCLGYRISDGKNTMLFSGDSAWTPEFVTRSRDTDLFLSECCTLEPAAPIHMCWNDIVAHRHELGCKRMVLTHLGADVRSSDKVTIERAYDGMVIDIG